MKKILKKIGNSIGLSFSREEQKIYDLRIGKIIDLPESSLKDIEKKINIDFKDKEKIDWKALQEEIEHE